jgi:carbamoyltransferase
LNIMAFGGSVHDFSVSLLIDGKLVCYAEEDRLVGSKRPILARDVFRCKAAAECLRSERLTLDDIDLMLADDLVERLYYVKFERKRIVSLRHHTAHAASAFYASPFEAAAVLVADGRGSYVDGSGRLRETVSWYEAEGNRIAAAGRIAGEENEDRTAVSHSIGMFSQVVSEQLGLEHLQDDTMTRLAADGSDRRVAELRRFYECDADGNFIQTLDDADKLRRYVQSSLQHCRNAAEKRRIKADIAYAAVHHIADAAARIAGAVTHRMGTRRLCVAGSVFLQSGVLDKLIERLGDIELFVQPAAGDSGTSIGSCLYGWHHLLNLPRQSASPTFEPYLGPRYSDEAMIEACAPYSEQIVVQDRTSGWMDTSARLLEQGHLLAWYCGRSAVGSHDLGARAILADPRGIGSRERLNSLKGRDRSYPVSVLMTAEAGGEYLADFGPSKFRSFLYGQSTARWRVNVPGQLPAVSHRNGTGRPQFVRRDLHPELYGLLRRFAGLTNIPLLLASSLNDSGYPPVETPAQVVQWFVKADVEFLVAGRLLLAKRNSVRRGERT